jgi:hypothetical protein
MAKRNWEERQRFKHEKYGYDEETGPESADFAGITLTRDDWRSARLYRYERPRESFQLSKVGYYFREGWRSRPGASRAPSAPFEVRKLGQYLRDGWRTRPGASRTPSAPFELRKLAQYLRDGWRTRPVASKRKSEPFEFRKLGQYLRDGWRTRPGASKRKLQPFELRKVGQYLRDGWRSRPGAPKVPFEFRHIGRYFRDGWRTRPGAAVVRYGYRVEILDRHEGRFDREISDRRDWRETLKFCESCGGELERNRKDLCRECALDLVEAGDIEPDEAEDCDL